MEIMEESKPPRLKHIYSIRSVGRACDENRRPPGDPPTHQPDVVCMTAQTNQ